MTLQALVNHNYKELNTAAINIAGNKNTGQDLMSSTYIALHDNPAELPKDNKGFIKFFTKCMSNQFKWSKSNFNKEFIPKEVITDFEYADIPEESEPCKECLFNELEIFKKALPPHEKILYELNIESKIPCHQIAMELTKEFKYIVKTRSIIRLMAPIKNKLKNRKWNI